MPVGLTAYRLALWEENNRTSVLIILSWNPVKFQGFTLKLSDYSIIELSGKWISQLASAYLFTNCRLPAVK